MKDARQRCESARRRFRGPQQWAVAAAASLAAAVSTAAQETQAYLKVSRLTASKGAQTRWDPSSGFYARDYTRCIGLQIQVRGMGKTSAGLLEWYFIAKDNRSDRLWIFDLGQEEIVLDAAKPVTLQKISKDLASSVTQTMYHREEIGSRIEGYIVCVTAGGKLVSVAASSKPLETLARDAPRFTNLKESSAKIREEMAREDSRRNPDWPRPDRPRSREGQP